MSSSSGTRPRPAAPVACRRRSASASRDRARARRVCGAGGAARAAIPSAMIRPPIHSHITNVPDLHPERDRARRVPAIGAETSVRYTSCHGVAVDRGRADAVGGVRVRRDRGWNAPRSDEPRWTWTAASIVVFCAPRSVLRAEVRDREAADRRSTARPRAAPLAWSCSREVVASAIASITTPACTTQAAVETRVRRDGSTRRDRQRLGRRALAGRGTPTTTDRPMLASTNAPSANAIDIGDTVRARRARTRRASARRSTPGSAGDCASVSRSRPATAARGRPPSGTAARGRSARRACRSRARPR